jgi:hypothetical protein
VRDRRSVLESSKTSGMAKTRGKRPITEAFLHAEASYGRARRRIETTASKIGTFRRFLCSDAPSFIEVHIQNLEEDITRHSKQLEILEEQYRSSKAAIYRFIREKLRLHESFFCFLRGFSDPNGSCLLPILNQGPETTCIIKQMIADFAGVPTGKTLGDFCELEQTIRHVPAMMNSKETSVGKEPRDVASRKPIW